MLSSASSFYRSFYPPPRTPSFPIPTLLSCGGGGTSLSGRPSFGSYRLILVFKTDLHSRLLDIVHADQKLYLVFEFLDVDLKRYIETSRPLKMDIVKVCYVHPLFIRSLHILNCDQTQFIFLFRHVSTEILPPAEQGAVILSCT
jgi:hypothetical protein